MRLVESYKFENGDVSEVLQDEAGRWFLGDGSNVEETDEEGANLIIRHARFAKARDAEEWPEFIGQ